MLRGARGVRPGFDAAGIRCAPMIDLVTGELITSSGLDIPLGAGICTALTP
jgi:hypothetical protein